MVKGLTKRKRGGGMEKKVKKKMIKEAKKLYSRIFPCGVKRHLEDCFTITDDSVLLWFNTRDKHTHVLMSSRDVNS